MPTTLFTVRQLAEAMIADNTPKAIGAYEDSAHKATCALGGAAKILGLHYHSLGSAVRGLHNNHSVTGLTAPEVDEEQWKKAQGGLRPFSMPVIKTFISSVSFEDMFYLITFLNDYTTMSKAEIGQRILNEGDEELLNSTFAVTTYASVFAASNKDIELA